jgi:hypothetical protein
MKYTVEAICPGLLKNREIAHLRGVGTVCHVMGHCEVLPGQSQENPPKPPAAHPQCSESCQICLISAQL